MATETVTYDGDGDETDDRSRRFAARSSSATRTGGSSGATRT
jgi:hypothetical protein